MHNRNDGYREAAGQSGRTVGCWCDCDTAYNELDRSPCFSCTSNVVKADNDAGDNEDTGMFVRSHAIA